MKKKKSEIASPMVKKFAKMKSWRENLHCPIQTHTTTSNLLHKIVHRPSVSAPPLQAFPKEAPLSSY